MKKWYKSAFCKGMLILAAHISFAAALISMMFVLAYPGQNYEDFFTEKSAERYEETTGFARQMRTDVFDVLNMLETDTWLTTEGNINLDKVVDIPFFEAEGGILENPGEFSFSIKNILDEEELEQEVIVCRKPDGELKYQYFTHEGLAEFIRANEYDFAEAIDEFEPVDREEILRKIEEEYYIPQYHSESGIVVDKDKNPIFVNMWSFSYSADMDCLTPDGRNILDIANTSAEWNGKLERMSQKFDRVRNQLSDLCENFQYGVENYSEGNTNLSYLLVDHNKNKVYTNRAEYRSIENVEDSIYKMTKSGKYVMVAPTLEDCSTNMESNKLDLTPIRHRTESVVKDKKFTFIVSVNTEYPIQDTYYIQNEAYGKYMPIMNKTMKAGILSTVVFFICFVWLTAVAGRSNEKDGVALMFFDRWKTEIGLAAIGTVIFGAVWFAFSWMEEVFPMYWAEGMLNAAYSAGVIAVTAAVGVGVCAAFLIGYLSFVRRVKAQSLWGNSILRWLVQTIKFIFVNRSCVTKGIIVGSGLFFINLMMLSNSGFFVMLAVVVDALAVVLMIKRQIEKEKIKKGIMRIANGDADYKIPLGNLTGDNRDIAEKVNHIGEGIQNAVEKSLKDERLKTDLITNVSHDIKTPLTSIINYVGLLKQEHFDDPKIQRYLDILEQKSQRLKTLTEDVVEASKISSGNINLEFINLNLVEMIHQTTGEFVEKFEKKDLKMVLNVPTEPAIIRVDGRRMWRVIENIYNNAAKYAMSGTRIYADMTANGKVVQFSLKNVSEHPLNITADELTERFIRGDISRSTEGSGLGLSIAKNLTEMQGGEFKLYVDGDLFKVTITFPQIKSAVKEEE